MGKLTLAPNVPVAFDVKYADIVSGQYGVDLRLKGLADGQDAVFYLPVDEAMPQLLAGGILRQAPAYDPNAVPPKGLAVRLEVKRLTLVALQQAGEKKPRVVITAAANAGGAAPAPTPAAAAAPTHGNGHAANGTGAAVSATAERKPVGMVYLECVDFVLDRVAPKFAERKIPLTDAAIAAMTATLFIQRQNPRY